MFSYLDGRDVISSVQAALNVETLLVIVMEQLVSRVLEVKFEFVT